MRRSPPTDSRCGGRSSSLPTAEVSVSTIDCERGVRWRKYAVRTVRPLNCNWAELIWRWRALVSPLCSIIQTSFPLAVDRQPEYGYHLQAGAPPLVIAIERLAQQKDFGTLLEASRQLRRRREAGLIFLGEEPDRNPLGELRARRSCQATSRAARVRFASAASTVPSLP